MNQITILNRYIITHLFQATAIIAFILIGIVFLTQSIRFLELVVEVGASSSAFWFLTLLALPRFFEVIVPIAVMIAVLFIYHRLVADSELVIMRSAGLSSMQLARPALFFIGLVVVFLYIMAFYAGPKSASYMQYYRQVIKANATQLFFREGVFNTMGDGLMIYIRNKGEKGELSGLMIYDSRPKNDVPVTVLAEKGVLVSDPDGSREILVSDGQRQQYNPQTQILNKLAFERYTVEIPEPEREVRQRWAEPDERTMWELIFPQDKGQPEYERAKKAFVAEANRRMTGPLLTLSFGCIALAFMLLGTVSRHGYTGRIIVAAVAGIFVQSFYLIAFDVAKQALWGNLLMYLIVLIPIVLAYIALKHFNRLVLNRGLRPPEQEGEPAS